MRYGIFSDVHSNLEALDSVIGAYKNEGIDKYFCAGDLVGYAANPRECIEKVRSLKAITVAGNHDWASVDLTPVHFFNLLARQAICWTRGNLTDADKSYLQSLKLVFKNGDFTLAHGTLDNPHYFDYLTDTGSARGTFKLLENSICFVGHTHISGIFVQDKNNVIKYQRDYLCNLEYENKYIVNVGSVGQPRDDHPEAAYCVYDTDKRQVQIKRISYAIEMTRKKIDQAGLPRFFADRLLSGS